MSPRYNFDFKILSGRNPFLRASPGSKLLKLIGVIKAVLQTVVTAINNAYDARFISTASGGDLDKHGVTLDLPRSGGESDDDYRGRLLTEFQDIPVGLTVQSIKNAVDQVMGPGTEIDEYYKSIWSWPDCTPPDFSYFGNSTIGSDYKTRLADEKIGCRFQIPNDGGLLYIKAYLEPETPTAKAYCAVYSDNAGAPGAKLADADDNITIDSAGWYTFNFTKKNLTKDNFYWLAINITEGDWHYYYDTGDTNQSAYNADTPPPDDPFGTPNYLSDLVSIFAYYMLVDADYSWEKPFNSFGNRRYAAAIVSSQPTENELDQIEQNVIAKKPAHITIRIVEEQVGYYELYREIK